MCYKWIWFIVVALCIFLVKLAHFIIVVVILISGDRERDGSCYDEPNCPVWRINGIAAVSMTAAVISLVFWIILFAFLRGIPFLSTSPENHENTWWMSLLRVLQARLFIWWSLATAFDIWLTARLSIRAPSPTPTQHWQQDNVYFASLFFWHLISLMGIWWSSWLNLLKMCVAHLASS